MKNGHTSRHDNETGFGSSWDVSWSEDESIAIDTNDRLNAWIEGNEMIINGYECENLNKNGRYCNYKNNVWC